MAECTENHQKHSVKDNTRRVILIGKTGNGKSSTGNSILGRVDFISRRSLNAVTKECQVRKGIQRKNWPSYEVCDTLGLFDTEVSIGDQMSEALRSIDVCPKPHAFLIVFSTLNRMTEEEKFTIDKLRLMFGEEVFKHCIIVFTRGNEFTSDAEFEEFYKENPVILELHKRCGGRIVRIENKVGDKGAPIGEGINRLFHLIEEVSDSGKHVYAYSFSDRHREALEEHRDAYKGTADTAETLTDISERVNNKLGGTWKTELVGFIFEGLHFVATVAFALMAERHKNDFK